MNEASKHLPVVEVRPERGLINFDLKEIWQYRELIYYLTLREIQIRYKQTAIGVIWAVLQPVITTIIFTIIFSRLAQFESGNIPYPLFALSGLLIWLYVNNAVAISSQGLINNPSLITKVYVPRVLLPTSVVLSTMVDLMIGLLILTGVLVYYQVPLSAKMLLAPVFILLAVILSESLGLLFSALNVRYRDVKHALPFLLQIWMFLSPVFYTPEMLSEKWRTLLQFNPLYGVLQGFRASLLDIPFDWPAIGFSAVSIIILFIFSFTVFKRMEDTFADVI
jgi:lipopolysaccharide transport system permease protein